MRNSKLFISAVAPLRPINIWDTKTGELISSKTLDQDIDSLVSFVQSEVKRTFEESTDRVIEDAERLKGSANSYARKLGYTPSHDTLPREVLAKSRINELYRFKIMSEVASYAKNNNPDKNHPTFPKTVNLGAIDKQMASLSREGETLTLLWKCWSKEYLIEFRIPSYVLSRNIAKFSLPVVRYTAKGYDFIFTVQEIIPEAPKGRLRAGVDLGRVEPYTIAVVNPKGGRVAHYTSSGRLKELNQKRENILSHKRNINAKIDQYEKLGLDTEILETERSRLGNKAKKLGYAVANHAGSEITQKLAKHSLNTLNVENLSWATGERYGSKWNHSRQQEAITHALLREGTLVKKVNPKNSSKHCHGCGSLLTNSGRKVRCAECRTTLDRDFNAAMNIATKNHLKKRYPSLNNRLAGDDCSPRQVIGHEDHSSVVKLVT